MRRRTLPCFGAIVGTAALVAAATLLVASPAAAIDVSNEAQLRAAIADVDETEVRLTSDITLTDCSAGGGDLDRVDGQPLTLFGEGFTIAQTCDGEGVIEFEGINDVAINDVTITGGDRMGLGGAIYTRNGSLEVTDSSILGNRASGAGGGINGDFTDIAILRSTVAGNSAANTGGIYTNGDLDIGASTITGNESTNNTGGIEAAGDIVLGLSTIVGNTGPQGANISSNQGGQLFTVGSVIALPMGGGENCDLTTPTASPGYNFSDDSSCGLLFGDVQDGGDPLLGPLADNGGPTLTRLPLTGSPLIDVVPPGACLEDVLPTDQRGVPRPVAVNCDVGSVEVTPDDNLPPDGPQTTDDTAATEAATTRPRFTG